MLTVALKNIRINAPHGRYDGEDAWGNAFEVDITVITPTTSEKEWPYIDYAILHEVVNKVFKTRRPLLEELVKEIHDELKSIFFDFPTTTTVTIRKMHPPMGGHVGFAEVTYES